MRQLRDKIRDLELMAGQKQIKIDFLEKMIQLTELDLGIEMKKENTSRK